ncbi:MAG TPA: hypothetical protein VKZ18_06580 [Polyangia bacterium]|nr:hypothetical protein [Polyangia bacterium]
MASRGWFVVVSSFTLALGACSKKAAPPPAPAPAPAVRAPAEPLPPVGMADPFARLTGDGVKSLNAGYKAMRAKDYDAARTAFAAVVAAFPDYSPARMQELKAAALGGHTADVPALWKELLARDFVASVGRLDKPKELAPLRAAPEWSRLEALEASVRPAYAAGLGQGILFVGRERDPGVKGDEDMAKLDLHQEVYSVDPALARYRRLTDTDGHVYAFSVAPGNKALSFLVVTTFAAPTGATEFLDPNVSSIDLATLETTGPLPLGPPGTRAATIVLGWSGQGEPVWIVRPGNGGAEASYALDATRTAVVSVPVSGAIPTNRTVASPAAVVTEGETAAGVTLSDDRKSLQIAAAQTGAEDRTLRATRPLAPDAPRWSPSGQRLVYAGAYDDCAATAAGSRVDKNELYLWEKGAKAAARIATAPSALRARWLDDTRLAYQAGIGKQSRIHVLDVMTKSDATLKPRAGAAFVGFGTLFCPGMADEGLDAEDDPEN